MPVREPYGVNMGATLTFDHETNRVLGRSPVVQGTIASTNVWPAAARSKYTIPRGVLLGQSSNDSKWHVIRQTTFNATEAIGQTVLTVLHPENFQVGDNVKACKADNFGTYGYDQTVENLGAVTAVGTTTITVTTALQAEHVLGDYIYVAPATDYAIEIAKGILLGDAGGVRVMGADDVLADQIADILLFHSTSHMEAALSSDAGYLDFDKYVAYMAITTKARIELEAAFGRKCFVGDSDY